MPVANAAMEQWAHAVLKLYARGTGRCDNVSMHECAPVDDPQ
jgi:hypothetical protein